MSAQTDQLTAAVASLATLNDSVSPDIETLRAAHASVVAKGEALIQKLRSSTAPAAISAAAEELANSQSALTTYATKIEAVSTAFNQTISAGLAAVAPVVGVPPQVSASPPPLPGEPVVEHKRM